MIITRILCKQVAVRRKRRNFATSVANTKGVRVVSHIGTTSSLRGRVDQSTMGRRKTARYTLWFCGEDETPRRFLFHLRFRIWTGHNCCWTVAELKRKFDDLIIPNRPAFWYHVDKDLPNVNDPTVPRFHYDEIVGPLNYFEVSPNFWLYVCLFVVSLMGVEYCRFFWLRINIVFQTKVRFK